MSIVKSVLVIFITWLFSVTNAFASCMAPPCYQVEVSIINCEKVGWLTRQKIGFKYGREYAEAYRGSVVTGHIINQSKAHCKWDGNHLSDSFSPMSTKEPIKFFLREKFKILCDMLPTGAILKGSVTSACCDGDPNSPCMLGLHLYVESPTVGSPQPSAQAE